MKHAPNTIFRISICLGVSLCGWALAADDKKEAARKAALEAADRKSFDELLAEAKTDLESEEDARIDAAHQRIESELHRLAEQLYKDQAGGADGPQDPAAAGGDPNPASSPPDDDVIDAEYTEEKSDS